jgi:TetR/AcrR family transcriptional regulator, tetracycline repressor protein
VALDRPAIVRAALDLLDQVGLDGLTLRRLAAALNVQAPALYWHFANKQELLDEMGTAMLHESLVELDTSAPFAGTWRDFAVLYASGLRRMLLRHRDGAKVVSGTYLTDPTAFGAMNFALAVFVHDGFSAGDAAQGLAILYSYTIGFVIEEQAVFPTPGQRDPRYDLRRRAERIDERYTLAIEVGPDVFANYDERFAHGIEIIIRGLAH